MKFKSLLIASILAAGLSACNKDNEFKGEEPTNVNTYMTLQIVGPQGTNTKTTAGEDGTQVGTSEENTISSAMIILYDTETLTVENTHTLSSTDLLPTGNGYSTQALLAETGTYNVYVIANPPKSFSVTEGTLISNITETLMQDQYAKENTFIMFNESNGADKYSSNRIEITAENDIERPATCDPIALDRLAVKITSTPNDNVNIEGVKNEFKNDGGTTNIASVQLEGFKLLNGVTQTNLQQKWTKATTEQGSAAPWNNTLVTPQLENSTTGFYNHLTQFASITKEDEAYTAAKDLYSFLPYYNTTNSTAAIYCMENNSTWNGSVIVPALNGNTTGLVYQWKVTLNENVSDELAGENCFYSYNGKFFGKLEDIAATYPSVFEVAESSLEAAAAELSNAYSNTDKETAISNFRVKYNIKVYTEGIMYYIYYIKDQNYKQGEDGEEEPYYSVMRNTIYGLTVEALGRIGTDIPGGWNPESDPEDPIDQTNVYMIVQVKVNPWVLSNENITLE